MSKSSEGGAGLGGGREPRPNPLFMFLPSVSGSCRLAVDIPAGEERVKILKKNKVIPINSSVSTGGGLSSSKKRGRVPPQILPFRLPTSSEEDERSAGAGSSFGGSGDRMSAGPSTGYVPPLNENEMKMGLKLDRQDTGLLGSFRCIGQNNLLDSTGTPCKGRAIGENEFHKYIARIRKDAPYHFWTGLKDGLARLKELEAKNYSIEGKHLIGVVHEAATNTAVKFIGRLRPRVHPWDYLTMEMEMEDLDMDEEGHGQCQDQSDGMDTSNNGSAQASVANPGKRIVCCLDFLKDLMTGVLLGSEKQKNVADDQLRELLDNFYYYGLRAVVGHSNAKSNPATATGEGLKSRRGSKTSTIPCHWCDETPCNCKIISEGFQNANVALHALGLMDELAGPRLFAVIKKEMSIKIGEIGTEKVDSSNLDALKEWLNISARAWYTALYTRDYGGRLLNTPPPEFGQELTTMLLEQYGMAIIKDLFSVIIEFPDSKPLLDDLKICLKAVNLGNALVSNLKSSLERRLLNAGVNTSEVLEAYIATVRALKYVDQTGILVQLVTPPVREYLKHREETVRVILVSLTEESGELSEELARNPTNPDRSCKLTLQNYKLWNPDPIDVPKDKHNLRKSDLIEAMVSIYGSKTVFIDEYRALLADRLLRMPKPGSITREIKCLELLKLRFGEADLQKCEVMLKDVSDSQRLNTRFYEEEGAVLANEAVQVSGLVVSAQFWPSFKQEDLILPVPVQAALEKYTKAFEMIKGNRTLEWQQHIGTVKLEIEHGGNKISYSVSPLQATIIWHFQEQEKWALDDLAKATGTSSSYLSNRMGFWVSKGMIVHTGQGNYVLADCINQSSKATGVIPNKYVEEVETDSPMASTSSQRASELQVFWSYIEAMLTNLESLPLARIHSMLKLFATVECCSEDLQKFLDDKVSHNLLVYAAGQYQLPK